MKDGRILILEIELDDQSFTLINLYHPNTESEQIEVLEKLENMLSISNPTQVSQIIFAGDLFFLTYFLILTLKVMEETQFLKTVLS